MCGKVLPESEFYRHHQLTDGTWSLNKKCKRCYCAHNNAYHRAHYSSEKRRERYEREREKFAQYYQDNKEKLKKQSIHRTRNQRAKEKGATDTLSLTDWEKILKKFGNRCAYCGSDGKPLGLGADHLIPLTKGGTNTPDNVVPCCRSCNSRKNTKAFFDWYPVQEFFDADRLTAIIQHRMEGV